MAVTNCVSDSPSLSDLKDILLQHSSADCQSGHKAAALLKHNALRPTTTKVSVHVHELNEKLAWLPEGTVMMGHLQTKALQRHGATRGNS